MCPVMLEEQTQGRQGLRGKGEGKAQSSLGLTCRLAGEGWVGGRAPVWAPASRSGASGQAQG